MVPVQPTLADRDQDIIIIGLGILLLKQRRRFRRWNVHPVLQSRNTQGVFHTLVKELGQFEEKFFEFHRMSREQFAQVFHLVEEGISKTHHSRTDVIQARERLSLTIRMSREQFAQVFHLVEEGISKTHHSRTDVIQARERLSLTIRYLATGESYRSLAFAFRIGVSTVAQIVPEVCAAIWNKLSVLYMQAPNSPEEWKAIAEQFWIKWQFPQCLGAIDGKHVVMRKPDNSGSLYFNYKGTCSVVLLALVDANLKFIAVDIGAFGRNSDGSVFSRSFFGKRFIQKSFNFPADDVLPNYMRGGPVPFVAVGDEAFPLMTNLMRPYPGRQLSLDKRIFNYRLSRARRIVENAFGILAARWRVFHTKIAVNRTHVTDIVKAATVLHNMLQALSTASDIKALVNEAPDLSHAEGICPLAGIGGRARNDAKEVRDRYKDFFLQDGSVPWQERHVERGYLN